MDSAWCDTCRELRKLGHTCWPIHECEIKDYGWDKKVNARDASDAAEKAAEAFNDEEPADPSTTLRVVVTCPNGEKKGFTVHAEYSIDYTAYEEDTVE